MSLATFRYQNLSYGSSSVVREDTIEYGYNCHTTGSGKTLTSFRAPTPLKDNPDILKCLLVIDCKDTLPGQLFYSTQIPVCWFEKLGIAGQNENN